MRHRRYWVDRSGVRLCHRARRSTGHSGRPLAYSCLACIARSRHSPHTANPNHTQSLLNHRARHWDCDTVSPIDTGHCCRQHRTDCYPGQYTAGARCVTPSDRPIRLLDHRARLLGSDNNSRRRPCTPRPYKPTSCSLKYMSSRPHTSAPRDHTAITPVTHSWHFLPYIHAQTDIGHMSL